MESVKTGRVKMINEDLKEKNIEAILRSFKACEYKDAFMLCLYSKRNGDNKKHSIRGYGDIDKDSFRPFVYLLMDNISDMLSKNGDSLEEFLNIYMREYEKKATYH